MARLKGDDMNLQDWLLLTTLGGLLAIAGTSLGAWWQLRISRETRREQYRREDMYRLQNERRQAYASYIITAGRVRTTLKHLGPQTSREEAMAARNDLYYWFIQIRLMGGHDVVMATEELLQEVNEIIFGGGKLEEERYRSLVMAAEDAARRDLLRDSDPRNAPQALSKVVS
jgi:hypothetical protein